MQQVNQSETISDDLLDGLSEIAMFIYGRDDEKTCRRVQYEASKGYLPTWKHGGHVQGSKRELREHFSSSRAA